MSFSIWKSADTWSLRLATAGLETRLLMWPGLEKNRALTMEESCTISIHVQTLSLLSRFSDSATIKTSDIIIHIIIISLLYIYIYICIYIYTYICMNGGQHYLLLAMDMAKVGGPLYGLWRVFSSVIRDHAEMSRSSFSWGCGEAEATKLKKHRACRAHCVCVCKWCMHVISCNYIYYTLYV